MFIVRGVMGGLLLRRRAGRGEGSEGIWLEYGLWCPSRVIHAPVVPASEIQSCSGHTKSHAHVKANACESHDQRLPGCQTHSLRSTIAF
jgi:hypothetical protein